MAQWASYGALPYATFSNFLSLHLFAPIIIIIIIIIIMAMSVVSSLPWQ
jgi:hypothetical protein